MRKILGGKDKTCCICGGMTLYIKNGKVGVHSQCKNCGALTDGREKDEVKIFEFDSNGELVKGCC